MMWLVHKVYWLPTGVYSSKVVRSKNTDDTTQSIQIINYMSLIKMNYHKPPQI